MAVSIDNIDIVSKNTVLALLEDSSDPGLGRWLLTHLLCSLLLY